MNILLVLSDDKFANRESIKMALYMLLGGCNIEVFTSDQFKSDQIFDDNFERSFDVVVKNNIVTYHIPYGADAEKYTYSFKHIKSILDTTGIYVIKKIKSKQLEKKMY